ncbi:DapH/DapD/GlmU-related protein [Rhizobium grahamii]|uniref:Putative colanic acid biosynthesis acetyltransferase n=1 Tax=Rhizobium grahamii TaxID=1120045 RepID=A0A370KNF9_9HYPH|nr:DapH/DapD/GlmU-related protein [Rhizobium grahamii]RDJ10386.1 putative colanic acid biosynthesis acetyltransferase [Rhizobium grahamii]
MEQHALGILDARTSGSRTGGPSFSLQHRMLRAAWAVAWTLLAAWTPAPLHQWRAMLLRMFGAQLGANARVHASARIWYPPNLVMEENTLVGPRVTCYAMAPIRICRNAVISQGAHLCAGSHVVDDPYFQLEAHPITIGANAWVAAEAFVGPGVILEEGSVLGARGVAFSNIPAWTIFAGNPARFLRKRVLFTSPGRS